jgi:hypothetical protein
MERIWPDRDGEIVEMADEVPADGQCVWAFNAEDWVWRPLDYRSGVWHWPEGTGGCDGQPVSFQAQLTRWARPRGPEEE